jgi:hypothetical protein
MNLENFPNLESFRVECPVCKSRRKLKEMEKNDCRKIGKYMAYQFCKESCKERAKEEHHKRIEQFNPHK